MCRPSCLSQWFPRLGAVRRDGPMAGRSARSESCQASARSTADDGSAERLRAGLCSFSRRRSSRRDAVSAKKFQQSSRREQDRALSREAGLLSCPHGRKATSSRTPAGPFLDRRKGRRAILIFSWRDGRTRRRWQLGDIALRTLDPQRPHASCATESRSGSRS